MRPWRKRGTGQQRRTLTQAGDPTQAESRQRSVSGNCIGIELCVVVNGSSRTLHAGGPIAEVVQTAGGALTFETGRLAPQADSAVTATLGQTCVLAAIVAEPMRGERALRSARHLTGLKVRAPRATRNRCFTPLLNMSMPCSAAIHSAQSACVYACQDALPPCKFSAPACMGLAVEGLADHR